MTEDSGKAKRRKRRRSSTPGNAENKSAQGRGRGSEGQGQPASGAASGSRREDRSAAKTRAARKTAAGATQTSPLDFWRHSSARSHRPKPLPKGGFGRWWRQARGLYFPPWVPVVAVILVVFGILFSLFFVRSATGAPRVNDHWHATYQISLCGVVQPNLAAWVGGVHTHGDGVIHIHPESAFEEGSGARLVKWFEYGGGKLTKDEMRLPGQRETYKNGDACSDGSTGVIQVFVNGERKKDYTRYVPQDGDRVRIVFASEEAAAAPSEQKDRTIIPEEQATRTVSVELTDAGPENTTRFSPSVINVSVGETVRFAVRNTGTVSHTVRVVGADGQYQTKDDFVSNPDIIQPGHEGFLVVRFDKPGEFEFKDLTASGSSPGKIVVQAAAQATPAASPSPAS